MAIAKRVVLFLLTNFLIVMTISIILNLLGLNAYFHSGPGGLGIDYAGLMVFCLLWGFGGAFISLLLSKRMAKWMMRVKIIEPRAASSDEQLLVQMVHRLATTAGLSKMPEVGIYQSPEVNAFATGPSKNNSLVAVSSGLLQRMRRDEVEGVLGHEVAHIANGDMVTMTLLQGVINAFVMFFARIVAFAVTQAMSRSDNDSAHHGVNYLLVFLFEMVFGFLGMLVIAYFSRMREFRADRGGARLAGQPKMVAALTALKGTLPTLDREHEAMASLKISGARGLLALFSTHPPLEVRIRKLQEQAMGLS